MLNFITRPTTTAIETIFYKTIVFKKFTLNFVEKKKLLNNCNVTTLKNYVNFKVFSIQNKNIEASLSKAIILF